MGHAIVVGGSGMLAGTVRSLAGRLDAVTVLARGKRRLAALERTSGVHGLSVDYRDRDALRAALDVAIAARGAASLLVLWVHSSAPGAPLEIARALAALGSLDVVHVLGSASADPAAAAAAHVRRAAFGEISGVSYREVILGFVRDRAGSRWLANDEIAAGVTAAVESGASRSIVGTVTPWSDRP